MAHAKGVLIERLQQDGKQPRFDTETRGPKHAPEFHSEVSVEGTVLGRGQGGTKRTAERRAAEEALSRLDAAASTTESAPSPPPKAEKSSSPKRPAASKATKTTKTSKAEASDKTARTTTVRSTTTQTVAPSRANRDAVEAEPDATPFDGPWPVFETLLASSLQVAQQRISLDLRGDEAREAVQAFALRLYKDLLLDLGDVVDEESPGET